MLVRETPELMPAPIQYSHAILRRLAEVRKNGTEPTLGPDAKSQLSLRYEDGKPVEVTSIVLSTQHLRRKRRPATTSARSWNPISAKSCPMAGSPRRRNGG
jgi:S-adenosylmethionine synthetase